MWIKGSDAHRDELIRRFDRAPQTHVLSARFPRSGLGRILAQEGLPADRVDPDAFLRFGYARILNHRQPRYAAMARWGVTRRSRRGGAGARCRRFMDLIAGRHRPHGLIPPRAPHRYATC